MKAQSTTMAIPPARAGFTLLELLAATVIISLLIAAVSGTVMTAFNMRADAQDLLEETLTNEAVANALKRDLQLMVAPAGIMAGAVFGESEEEAGGLRSDTLEFYSAGGVLNVEEPWGSVQKVAYYLIEPEDASPDAGKDLIRTVTRNLLPSTEEEPEEVAMLHGIESLTFSYYDGEVWRDTWDSTLVEDATPEAVYVRIEAMADTQGQPTPRPIESVCEIASRAASTGEQSFEEAL